MNRVVKITAVMGLFFTNVGVKAASSEECSSYFASALSTLQEARLQRFLTDNTEAIQTANAKGIAAVATLSRTLIELVEQFDDDNFTLVAGLTPLANLEPRSESQEFSFGAHKGYEGSWLLHKFTTNYPGTKAMLQDFVDILEIGELKDLVARLNGLGFAAEEIGTACESPVDEDRVVRGKMEFVH